MQVFTPCRKMSQGSYKYSEAESCFFVIYNHLGVQIKKNIIKSWARFCFLVIIYWPDFPKEKQWISSFSVYFANFHKKILISSKYCQNKVCTKCFWKSEKLTQKWRHWWQYDVTLSIFAILRQKYWFNQILLKTNFVVLFKCNKTCFGKKMIDSWFGLPDGYR